MTVKWKALFVSLAVPLAVGGLSAFLTKDSMKEFSQLRQPPLTPPMWVFPVVWTVLFVMMGFASYLIYTSAAGTGEKRRALTLYAVQLAVNFGWPILFFDLNWWMPAFFWLLLLWGLILWTMLWFGRFRRMAGLLLLPYLLWVAFAGYLNFGVYLLN